MAEEIKKLIKDRGVDITPLKKLLHETVDEEKIRNSHCELFATTFSVSDMKLLNIDVKSASEGKMEEILLASAFFPVFKTEKLSESSIRTAEVLTMFLSMCWLTEAIRT